MGFSHSRSIALGSGLSSEPYPPASIQPYRCTFEWRQSSWISMHVAYTHQIPASPVFSHLLHPRRTQLQPLQVPVTTDPHDPHARRLPPQGTALIRCQTRLLGGARPYSQAPRVHGEQTSPGLRSPVDHMGGHINHKHRSNTKYKDCITTLASTAPLQWPPQVQHQLGVRAKAFGTQTAAKNQSQGGSRVVLLGLPSSGHLRKSNCTSANQCLP